MLDFDGLPPLVDPSELSMPEGTEVVQADLDAVCYDIRVACGWHIAPRVVDLVMVVNAPGGTVLTVPSMKMAEPSAVVDRDGHPITGWSWSSNGILESACWPSGLRSVTVTADSGFTVCPSDIRAVIEDVLADRANVKSGGMQYGQISLDGASITPVNPYGDGAPGVRRGVMAAYGHILGRYAIR